jgi:hypothetical protein
LLILSPIFIIGVVFNYLPFTIPVWFTRKIKDIQFHSSFKFVIGLIIFPIYYLILLLMSALIFHGLLIKLAGILALIIMGSLALIYLTHLKKVISKWHYNSLSRKGKLDELFNVRNELFELLDNKVL